MAEPDLPTLHEFILWLEDLFQREVERDQLHQRSLTDHGFDSLDHATLLISISERFPGVDTEQVDGVIDPTLTIPELHHLIVAGLERHTGISGPAT